MQLVIIVQLFVALLAGEIAGALAFPAWIGAIAVVLAPLSVLVVGSWKVRRALRAMDRMETASVDALFAWMPRAPWLATMWIVIAAASELPTELIAHGGIAASASVLFSAGIAAALVASFVLYPVERRVRESSVVRTLDTGHAVHPMPSRVGYVWAQARAGLVPFVVPLIVPLVFGEVAARVALANGATDPENWRLVGMIAAAAALVVLVPLTVPPLLGLKRLAAGSLRDELEQLAREARVGVSEIWVWPTQGLVANAAVMGLFPRLRCVMLSDTLLEYMPREQILAVMAHELGHVARRHLVWMVAVISACWTLAGLIADPLAQAIFLDVSVGGTDAEIAELARWLALTRDALIVVAALWMFGWSSRRFERQADTYAVQVLSVRAGSTEATPAAVDAMVGALGAVAFLNHVPRARPSWRHGSIQWRQEYLRTLLGRTHANLPIDRLLAWLRWSALLLVLLALLVPRVA